MFRRSRRALALRLAAVVIALATAWVVTGDLARLHGRAAELGPVERLVVARHDLAIGTTVTRSDVTTRRVHRTLAPTGAIHTVDGVDGRVVAVPVLRGHFVAAGHVVSARRGGLDGLVPAGMRAVRVATEGSIRPRPGAVVDVIATFDASASSGRATTVVVAAGVVVVAADGPPPGTSTAGPVTGVTVLVTPDEAETVAGAMATGILTIALAPPEAALGRR